MTNPATADWKTAVYARGSNTEEPRRRPRRTETDQILAKQGDVCLYCGIPIGTVIERRFRLEGHRPYARTVRLRRNWDHFVPYAYAARNPGTNWVLACHVCNSIKYARMFETVEQARAVILPRRLELGYEAAPKARLRAAVLPPAASKPERASEAEGAPWKHAAFEANPVDPDLISEEEVAAFLRIAPGTLATGRKKGLAPPWQWGPGRTVLYSRTALGEWIDARTEPRTEAVALAAVQIGHQTPVRAGDAR